MNQLPRIILGLSFASFCLLATTGPAATYYVDGINGNNSNPGSSPAPWKTLSKAASTMASGDTAFMRAGTYTVVDATHVVVRKPDPGRAFGWPANGGIWSWGNEILVMYLDCPYKDNPGFSNHDSEQSHSSSKWVTSRSLDGGEIWGDHRVAFPALGVNAPGVKPTTLATPIAFDDPDTIVNFHWDGLAAGARTYLYYSTDRGRTWHGPYDNIPLFDAKAVTGRTDYEVTGKHSLTAWFSCTDEETEDCYRGSTYAFTTSDGGITWQNGPRTSREPSPCGSKYRGMDLPLATKMEYGHMPSTLRLDANTLVATFRSGDAPGGNFRAYGFPFRDGWIDVTRSTDNGKTWRPLGGHLMDMPTLNSSPPALSRLPSGRLVCSWGYRLPDDGSGPTAIQARTSDDNGATWGDTITLRHDGFDYDIGYNRQVVRPDGKVVTVYYYRTKAHGQSPTYIAATVWTPPAAPTRGTAARSPAFYYVDAVNGDDNNTGASLDQVWRTLQKVADTMASGDTAYVRAGTYRETVTPRNSQTFAAYRSEKPLITGTDPVSGWTVHSGSIYKATVNAEVYDVFVGTNYMHKARWPNFDGDYLDVSSWAKGNASKVAGNCQVAFDTLTPPSDLVGGWYSGIHGTLNFCPQEGRIKAIKGITIQLTDIRESDWWFTDPKHSGAGVGYIVNHLNCLDQPREWHWENNTLYFWVPGGGAPTDVLARARIYGFVLPNRSDVTLKGLYFLGASVHVNGGSNNTVDGCHFRNVSPWGNARGPARFATSWGSTEDGTTGLHISGMNHMIQNCSLVGGWGTGIRLDGGSDLSVRNNYLEDFGWFGRWLAAPISGFGTRLQIENNTIKRSGGCGITLVQKNPGDGANVNHVRRPSIRHNDIRDVTYLLMDGGSFIYINNDDVPSADRRLDGEIAFNVCVGLRSRSTDKFFWGIYIDNGADFVTLHHNVINSLNPQTAQAGIFLHGAQHKQENIFCYHNTIWGNFVNAIASHTWGKGSISNVVFRNNHAQKTGFRATAIGGVTASQNRENVPAGEFVDAANANFRLTGGSSSINAGAGVPGVNDAGSESPFAGNAPDLGAYEYNSVNWTAGSTITAPPAFPNE